MERAVGVVDLDKGRADTYVILTSNSSPWGNQCQMWDVNNQTMRLRAVRPSL